MICIFAALYKEAQPIIENLMLQGCNTYAPFKAFQNDNVTVVITGVGKTKISSAIGYVLGKTDSNINFVINIGICAGNSIGECFIVNSVCDNSTSRCFYPDMIIKNSFTEASLITVDNVINTLDSDDKHIYDMEGSAFMEAASIYFSPSRISLIKIISDNDGKKITPDYVYSAISNHMSSIRSYIDSVLAFLEQENSNDLLAKRIIALTNKYEKSLFASEYMRIELHAIIKYCVLANIDFDSVIAPYLPLENRREGKIVLEKLYEQFI